MDQHSEHHRFMLLALHEAEAALEHNDVPVGAVIVRDGAVIARGHNQRELLRDPTAHAEILALTAAAGAVGSWRLDDCVMYVTLEPCLMCAGALVNARMGGLVFGAHDPKGGACGSLYHIPQDQRLNHRFHVIPGVMATECGRILTAFFDQQRKLGKK